MHRSERGHSRPLPGRRRYTDDGPCAVGARGGDVPMRHPSTVALCALSAVAVTVAGCGVDPATVPVPGTGVTGDTYTVHVEFTDALNLPMRAKVFADGAQIGTVMDVSVVDPSPGPEPEAGYAVVDLELLESVRLPATTRAELRQQTILGDIHVALMTSGDDQSGDALTDGATIPRSRTRPTNQIEDTMAALALFVNGGAVTTFQEIVDELNSVLPADAAQTRRISENLAANARDLASNQDDLDVLLDGLGGATQQVADKSPLLADILTDGEVEQLVDAVSSLLSALGLFGRIAEISRALSWLAPVLTASDGAAEAFMPLAFAARPFNLDDPSNLKLLTELLRDKILPWFQYGPKVNVQTVTVGDPMSTDDQVDQIVDTLRMIGVVR
ncbi:MlaD family protein [Rhodococcus ruber]|uniref:MlaD family protein n=1 Tax=Rhodococcus ruber TaxID=1830 RepID=UPI00200FC674|nr:MlaD family protein [Rhodococcus ruber]